MATAQEHTPMSADAKLRVTLETAAQPVSTTTTTTKTKEATSASLEQILSSLAETRKYLPSQVYTFLDSMEGKTLDDLRVEAMNLASKAQEEAKKRADDVTTMGKSIVDQANNRVQDVTDKARERASSLVNQSRDLVQPPLEKIANKSMEAVQTPIEKTKEATKSLARSAYDRASDLTMQGYNMASTRLMPIIEPVATRAKEYLPETAKTFLKNNVEGKSIEELGNTALSATRKKLLNAKSIDNPPSMMQVVGEVKDATLSGDLFKNTLTLSEQAADALFGKTKIPSDATSLRRVYNLSTRTVYGMRDYTVNQLSMAKQQAMDMASKRAQAAKDMAMAQVNKVYEILSPIAQRVGEMPVIPSFVYRVLREEKPSSSDKSELETEKKVEKSTKVATVPTTSVRVDIVGMQPQDAPQATSTTSKDIKTTTTSSAPATSTTTLSSTVASKDMTEKSSEKKTENTTTGAESEIHETSEKKKKQHNKL